MGATLTSSTDPALALGQQLAERLDDWDVLGRWMAHHLAELIGKAHDSGDPADRNDAAEMILQIWRQRHTLGDKHPLHNYDAILSTLEHLDDRTAASRLSRHFGNDGPTDAERNVSIPLQLAVRLEETVQDVQTWLLAEAADAAEDHDAPWVALAREQRDNDEARALRRIQRTLRAFRAEADQSNGLDTDSDDQNQNENENENDRILQTLNRAIDLLSVLRDARTTQPEPAPTKSTNATTTQDARADDKP